jgi:hypothetical protein
VQLLSESFLVLAQVKGERKTTYKTKMKSLPGCSSEWDLGALSVLWSSICQTCDESNFLYSESESTQLTELKSEPGGLQCKITFCIEILNISIGSSFVKNNCLILSWILGQVLRKPEFFFRIKDKENVMWPFFPLTNCLWKYIYLSVCLPKLQCNHSSLLNDWNSGRKESPIYIYIYIYFIIKRDLSNTVLCLTVMFCLRRLKGRFCFSSLPSFQR